MRILYIDDNEINLNLYRSIIKNNYKGQISFLSTTSPEEFLNLARGNNIDLYLIDYTLSDCLGHELFEKLLEIIKNPSVIIITAGEIEDIKGIFMNYKVKPHSITDRFSAVEIIKEMVTL